MQEVRRILGVSSVKEQVRGKQEACEGAETGFFRSSLPSPKKKETRRKRERRRKRKSEKKGVEAAVSLRKTNESFSLDSGDSPTKLRISNFARKSFRCEFLPRE